jgi:2-keto-3-deoxy-galactonokinase
METVMTPALSYRSFAALSAERQAAHRFLTDAADAGIDDRVDDDLRHDTAEVCRKIAMNGMIGVDVGLFDDE